MPTSQMMQQSHQTPDCSWWRHQMETFSALLAICAGNSPMIGEFPTQRPVTRSFDVFFHLCVWINSWVNNREAGDLRRYRAHYDVIVAYVVFGTNIIHFRYEHPPPPPPPPPNTHTTMQHIFVCLYFHIFIIYMYTRKDVELYILRMCLVIVYEPHIAILHACALWRVAPSALVAIIESELRKMKVLECWRSIVLAIKAHYHLPRFHTHKKPVC